MAGSMVGPQLALRVLLFSIGVARCEAFGDGQALPRLLYPATLTVQQDAGQALSTLWMAFPLSSSFVVCKLWVITADVPAAR